LEALVAQNRGKGNSFGPATSIDVKTLLLADAVSERENSQSAMSLSVGIGVAMQVSVCGKENQQSVDWLLSHDDFLRNLKPNITAGELGQVVSSYLEYLRAQRVYASEAVAKAAQVGCTTPGGIPIDTLRFNAFDETVMTNRSLFKPSGFIIGSQFASGAIASDYFPSTDGTDDVEVVAFKAFTDTHSSLEIKFEAERNYRWQPSILEQAPRKTEEIQQRQANGNAPIVPQGLDIRT
jgi:hypothetical protein